jgi:3-oxoacyl-[acyl-carrier protein] reductase
MEASPPSPTNRRVAVVTGGSGGIGRAAARRLAADGLSIVVGYSGNPGPAEETVAEIAAGGGEALSFQADVADETAVAALFGHAESTYGGVDVVVHTAGTQALAALAELDLGVLDQVIRTNLRGTFVVNQQAVRRVRPGGAIINFSSSMLAFAVPRYSAYAASKGGVEAITMILARELRGRDVTVNAVAPGPTATPAFLNGTDEATIARLASQPPLERLGQPSDIAEVVAFLAGPGHWVNGQVMRANGGIA